MKTLKEIIMEKISEQSAFPFYNKNSNNFKGNMKGVDAEHKLNGSLQVVKKSGKQQLEVTKDGKIGVTDGSRTTWITVYSDGKWAADEPEFINKDIKDFLDRNASRVDNLADGFRGSKSVKEAVEQHSVNVNVGLDKKSKNYEKVKESTLEYAKTEADGFETDDSDEDTFSVMMDFDFSPEKDLKPTLLKRVVDRAVEQITKDLKAIGVDDINIERFGV